jgi:non-heme Fe2+,alpha-ketoglutarate-dependent halogenase
MGCSRLKKLSNVQRRDYTLTSSNGTEVGRRILRSISSEQLVRYEADGVIFPIPVLTPDELTVFKAGFDEVEARVLDRFHYAVFAHLYFRWAYDLATHPAVVDAVEDVLGPEILVYGTLIICKEPHTMGYVSWHQDGEGMGKAPSVSAWVGLTESTPESGCMRVLAGSHRLERLPHVRTYMGGDNMLRDGVEIRHDVRDEEATDVILEVGEMSLHHKNIIHGSNPNRSGGRRVGFIIRFVTPELKESRHPLIRVRGNGDCSHLSTIGGPPAGDLDDSIAEWQRRTGEPGGSVLRFPAPSNLD